MSGPLRPVFSVPAFAAPGERYDPEDESQFRATVKNAVLQMSLSVRRIVMTGDKRPGMVHFAPPTPPQGYDVSDESQFRWQVENALLQLSSAVPQSSFTTSRPPVVNRVRAPTPPVSYDRENESQFRRLLAAALSQGEQYVRWGLYEAAQEFVSVAGELTDDLPTDGDIRRSFDEAASADDAWDGLQAAGCVDTAPPYCSIGIREDRDFLELSMVFNVAASTYDGNMRRVFVRFDTTTLSAEPSAGTVTVKVPSETDYGGLEYPWVTYDGQDHFEGLTLVLVVYDRTDPQAAMDDTDQDNYNALTGATLASDDEFDVDSLGHNDEVVFNLNAAGLAHINLDGITEFGIVFKEDRDNAQPSDWEDDPPGIDREMQIEFYAADFHEATPTADSMPPTLNVTP